MLTFLAGFCAAEGPLAKVLGILLEKQPPPWGPTIPLGISKSYLYKNLQLGVANISGGFLRSWRSSGESLRDFTRKTAPPWGTTIPLGISKSYLSKNLQLGDATFLACFCAPAGPLAKGLGILL